MGFVAFLERLHAWAAPRDDVHGVAVVGSYARGTARADSDVDVVLLTTDPSRYTDERAWLGDFGAVLAWRAEDWGALHVVRTYYADGTEIEFGITSTAWAALPADAGTAGVIAGGCRIVFERDGLLSRLVGAGPAQAPGGAGDRGRTVG